MAQVFSSPSRIRREATILAVFLCLAAGLANVLPAQDSQSTAPDSAPATAPSDAPAGAPKASSNKGAEIFTSKCLVCHNKQHNDNSPFGPPNLFVVFKTKEITTAEAQQIILKGKGQMPAWNNILSKNDIQDVIAYLKTSAK